MHLGDIIDLVQRDLFRKWFERGFYFFCHSRRQMLDWDSVYLDLVLGSATTQKRCFQLLLSLCCFVAPFSARILGQTFITHFSKMFF